MKLEEMVGKRMTEAQFDEAAGEKDACYRKVKARYDVWPSAYASGALVKCRKVGAANWGNSKKEGVNEVDTPMYKITYQDSTGRKKTDIMRAKNSNLAKRDFSASNKGRGFKILKVVKEVLGEVSDAQKRKIYKKAFGKEYDDPKRRQSPLPLDIAYKVALNRLKKKEGLGDRMSKKLKKNKGVNLKKKIKDISKHEESFDTKFTKKKDVNEKKGDFLDSLFPKAKVDKAVKIAKSMGGNMTGAVKKIEKMFKGMSKHTKVKDALQQANESVNENKCLCEACWKGYEKKGMKKMFGKMYPNCVKKEGIQTTTWIGEGEVYWENNIGESGGYTFEYDNNDLNEAEYQGRKVKLGKIMQGDAKKFKVYVKNPKGNTVKVNFGQGGDAKGGTMKIRKSNPGARKSFRARHNCDTPGPRHKARYWSCRKW